MSRWECVVDVLVECLFARNLPIANINIFLQYDLDVGLLLANCKLQKGSVI